MKLQFFTGIVVCVFAPVLILQAPTTLASPTLEGGHAVLACTDCHLYEPDPADTIDTVTFVTADRDQLCVSCHETLPLLEYTNSPTRVQHNSDAVLSAIYTAAGAAAAGVALGAMNRSKKNKAIAAHNKTTIDDLEK